MCWFERRRVGYHSTSLHETHQMKFSVLFHCTSRGEPCYKPRLNSHALKNLLCYSIHIEDELFKRSDVLLHWKNIKFTCNLYVQRDLLRIGECFR